MDVVLGVVNNGSNSTDFPSLCAANFADGNLSGKALSAVKVCAGSATTGINLTEAYVVVLD